MIPLLLTVLAFADFVPMRWPAAPPESLDLLKGTPVNCVLVEEPGLTREFRASAADRKLTLFVVVHPGENAEPSIRRAATLRPDGFVFEGDFDPAERDRLRTLAARPVIEMSARRAIRFHSGAPALGTAQGVWPGIEIEHGGKVMTGPTSAPWIYTNAGFLRFARAMTESPVWIGVRPPPGNIYRPQRYVQAIADAEIGGARWPIALDESLQSRLLKQDPAALRDWDLIVRHLRFLEAHREAARWPAWSQFAVVQDLQSGGLLTSGLLDMLAAQRTSIQVIPAERLSPAGLNGVRIVLDVMPERLTDAQREVLDHFRKTGGEVLNPPSTWRFPEVPATDFVLGRRQLDQMQPLWELTYKATLRKNFGVRTFNTSGVLTNTVAAPDGNTVIVYLVNYTDFSAENITVHALGEWKRARLLAPGEKDRDLELYPVAGGAGVDLPTLGTVAIIRFER